MRKDEARKLPKYTPNPLLVGLPEYLKEPEIYDKIRRAILDTIAVGHSHSEMLGWFQCKTCQDKSNERLMLIEKLGFKTPQQFMEWQKVMNLMISSKRVPLR